MGVLYIVWPVNAEMRDWLASQDVDAPAVDSRSPTKQEVTAVLNRLRGFQVRFTDNGPGARWDAFVQCREVPGLWTLLQAEPKDASDDVTEVTFEKCEPALIIALLRDLARQTGPLVLISDSGDGPLIVDPAMPYRELVEQFCDVDEESSSWPCLLEGADGTSDLKQ